MKKEAIRRVWGSAKKKSLGWGNDIIEDAIMHY